MAKYMVEVPHTAEECLAALDDILAKGPQFLNEFHWGCMAGVHTGWGIVEAESESAARNMLPASGQGKARITEVTKFTPEQVKAAHEKK